MICIYIGRISSIVGRCEDGNRNSSSIKREVLLTGSAQITSSSSTSICAVCYEPITLDRWPSNSTANSETLTSAADLSVFPLCLQIK